MERSMWMTLVSSSLSSLDNGALVCLAAENSFSWAEPKGMNNQDYSAAKRPN